jgi:uncharacterized DUF497 family protein
MKFEWDEQKSLINLAKHGVSFNEATEVFEDPLHIATCDQRFSYFEERWITLGQTKMNALLVVANVFFTDEGKELIRIISARKATTKERALYENAS